VPDCVVPDCVVPDCVVPDCVVPDCVVPDCDGLSVVVVLWVVVVVVVVLVPGAVSLLVWANVLPQSNRVEPIATAPINFS